MAEEPKTEENFEIKRKENLFTEVAKRMDVFFNNRSCVVLKSMICLKHADI